MKSHISLGRIAGIDVGINLSVVIIAALVTVALATGLLPEMAPGHESGAYWTGGVVGAISLLAAITAHELGHAVVAQRHGVRVERITLWALGGLAQLDGETESPDVELKIAGIGPAISLIIGGVAAVPSLFLDGLPGALVAWFAGINLLLGVFNLIPGTPLDGGRILHAILWKRHGNRQRATETASKAGRFVGIGLVALGIFQFMMGSFGGLWTALIGWFLQISAMGEARYGRLREDLRGLSVRDVMTPSDSTAPDWLSVGAFVERHERTPHRTDYLMIDFDCRVSGVLHLTDLMRIKPEDRYGTSIRTVARDPSDYQRAQAVAPAASLLTELARTPVVIVMDGETPIGLVSADEVAQAARTAGMLSRLRGD